MNHHHHRRGGVYIAVLGTSLIVSVLALSALVLQRLQNRMLAGAADIQQAQLNAQSAVQIGLLLMKQDDQWRDNYSAGTWFTGRSTGAGSCSLEVTDPADGDLTNSDDDPVVLTGIGLSGDALQRVSVAVDPEREPLGCLRSTVAAGGDIDLTNDTLRASGKITANSVSASSALVDADVSATSIAGSTYTGTTTEVDADELPTMPDWGTVFDEYLSNGTELNINNLPTSTTNNFGRNPSFDLDGNPPPGWTPNPSAGWTGDQSLILPAAQEVKRVEDINGHTACLRIKRTDKRAGAAQFIDGFLEPNQSYHIEMNVYVPQVWPPVYVGIRMYTQEVGGPGEKSPGSYVPRNVLHGWLPIAADVTTPNWSGPLERAFIVVNSDTSSGNADTFYIDNVVIRENLTGRLIYQKVLSPNVNQLYAGAPTNSQGIYWINCNGNPLIIKRSRIEGTLLVINPGANSYIGGSVHWSPAVPGYPALIVDGNFTIAATNRILSETENQIDFNPPGAAHDQFGADADLNDIYPSEIDGMVVISNDFAYQNSPRIRGQLVVGGDIRNSSGSLDVEYQPDSLLSPPPGFSAPPILLRRPGSTTKVVLP